jgi:type VI secretion system protein VasG
VLPRLSALWLDAFSSKRPLTRISIDVGDENAAPDSALVFGATYATAPGSPEDVAVIAEPVPAEQAI